MSICATEGLSAVNVEGSILSIDLEPLLNDFREGKFKLTYETLESFDYSEFRFFESLALGDVSVDECEGNTWTMIRLQPELTPALTATVLTRYAEWLNSNTL